jgi:hypothetical protein
VAPKLATNHAEDESITCICKDKQGRINLVGILKGRRWALISR